MAQRLHPGAQAATETFIGTTARKEETMGKTIVNVAVVFLNGSVADDHDGIEPLFGWLGNGDVTWGPNTERELRTTQASDDFMRSHYGNVAAAVIGRRLFDLTNVGTAKSIAQANTSSWSPIGRRRIGRTPTKRLSSSSAAWSERLLPPSSLPANGISTFFPARSAARRSNSA